MGALERAATPAAGPHPDRSKTAASTAASNLMTIFMVPLPEWPIHPSAAGRRGQPPEYRSEPVTAAGKGENLPSPPSLATGESGWEQTAPDQGAG